MLGMSQQRLGAANAAQQSATNAIVGGVGGMIGGAVGGGVLGEGFKSLTDRFASNAPVA
jgi:hypothetical protein